MTIYKIETDEYVEDNEPLTLTLIEDEAMEFGSEIGTVLNSLNEGYEEPAFATGRPKDRQPK